jgi:hypothetical protein
MRRSEKSRVDLSTKTVPLGVCRGRRKRNGAKLVFLLVKVQYFCGPKEEDPSSAKFIFIEVSSFSHPNPIFVLCVSSKNNSWEVGTLVGKLNERVL